jgi:dienelactone hydrolase
VTVRVRLRAVAVVVLTCLVCAVVAVLDVDGSGTGKASSADAADVGLGQPVSTVPGTLGSYRVGWRQITFTEPARTGPAGERLGPRKLLTQIWLPGGRGLFPLIVFAPGYRQCGAPYADLLRAWASAGYVVAVLNFPRSDCLAGSSSTEADLVNEPGDISYLITRLLARSAALAGPLARMINGHQIGVAGHSDGAVAAVAITANTCCTDRRIKAAASLSGATWSAMPGRYFSVHPVPILFTQGSADVINLPSASLAMYRADRSRSRSYLDLLGASHTGPYWGTNPVERLVARVTLAFFDRYLLGRVSGATMMRHAAAVPGVAVLVSGGRPPP